MAAQFSLKDLFVFTTGIAVLAALLGESKLLQQSWVFTSLFVLNNAALAVACLILWSRNWHWALRISTQPGHRDI